VLKQILISQLPIRFPLENSDQLNLHPRNSIWTPTVSKLCIADKVVGGIVDEAIPLFVLQLQEHDFARALYRREITFDCGSAGCLYSCTWFLSNYPVVDGIKFFQAAQVVIIKIQPLDQVHIDYVDLILWFAVSPNLVKQNPVRLQFFHEPNKEDSRIIAPLVVGN